MVKILLENIFTEQLLKNSGTIVETGILIQYITMIQKKVSNSIKWVYS